MLRCLEFMAELKDLMMLLLTLATKQLHIHSVSFLTKVSHPLQKKEERGRKKKANTQLMLERARK